MKSDTTDSAVNEDDVGEITRKQSDVEIYRAWDGGDGLIEIAGQTGLTIEEVNRRLKLMLKAEIEHGGENHEDEIIT